MRGRASPLRRYLDETRRPDVSLLLIAPLVAAHALLAATVPGAVSVSSERAVVGLFTRGGAASLVLGAVLAVLVLGAAASVRRDRVPLVRHLAPFLAETLLFAALLGPLLALLTGGSPLHVDADSARYDLLPYLIGSVGAGIYEEIAFRLLLLGGCYALLARGLGAPRALAAAGAIAVSALAFALAHLIGPGAEPYRPLPFAFRTAAGVVLGALFAARGLGVVVYLHAFYDVLHVLRLELTSPT